MATKTAKAKKTAAADTAETTTLPTSHPSDFTKVKVGDLMAITHFVKVKEIRCANGRYYNPFGAFPTNVTERDELLVTSLDEGGPGEFKVEGKSLVERMTSADQYAEERHLSQTDVIDILMTAHNRPFTVCFDKDNGEERVLRGRLLEPDGRRGRSKVLDLDQPIGRQMRLVDHRTLKWLTINGIKFTAK